MAEPKEPLTERELEIVRLVATGAGNKEIASHFSSPILYQGFIYGTTYEPDNLVCLDPQTGTAKWRANGFGRGGLAAIEDVLMVEDANSGEVALVKLSPDAYTELGRIKPRWNRGGQAGLAQRLTKDLIIIPVKIGG